MRAVVLHGPGDLRLDEVPDAELPAGGLLVRPRAIGICGSDVRTWRHGSPRLHGPQVLGHEFAGIVAATDVGAIPPGTPVAVCPGAPCGHCRACLAGHANLCRQRLVLGYDLPGGMADLVAVPADWVRAGGVVTLDPVAPIERGAIVEPLHTVLNGQDQILIKRDERVLVLGLGPIGVLHVAVARSEGAAVVGLDPDPDRVARAATILGAGSVGRLGTGPDGRVGTAADGGFDVVIVAVGARDALATAIASVEPGGRILAFAGLPADSRTIELDMNDLHYRQLAIQGAFGGTPDTFRRAAAWLAANPLDMAAFAPGRFPLGDALAAFEAAAAGHGLKTLLVTDEREASRTTNREVPRGT
jgi:L-iditol 2-dehydrogenase